MAKSFEEVVLMMLGKIDARLDRIEATLAQHGQQLAEHSKRHDQHDEMFAKIIDGIIPEIEKRTLLDIKLKDHERRITALEST